MGGVTTTFGARDVSWSVETGPVDTLNMRVRLLASNATAAHPSTDDPYVALGLAIGVASLVGLVLWPLWDFTKRGPHRFSGVPRETWRILFLVGLVSGTIVVFTIVYLFVVLPDGRREALGGSQV